MERQPYPEIAASRNSMATAAMTNITSISTYSAMTWPDIRRFPARSISVSAVPGLFHTPMHYFSTHSFFCQAGNTGRTQVFFKKSSFFHEKIRMAPKKVFFSPSDGLEKDEKFRYITGNERNEGLTQPHKSKDGR